MVFGIAVALYMVSEGNYYKSGVSFQGWLLLVVDQGFVFIYVGSWLCVNLTLPLNLQSCWARSRLPEQAKRRLTVLRLEVTQPGDYALRRPSRDREIAQFLKCWVQTMLESDLWPPWCICTHVYAHTHMQIHKHACPGESLGISLKAKNSELPTELGFSGGPNF